MLVTGSGGKNAGLVEPPHLAACDPLGKPSDGTNRHQYDWRVDECRAEAEGHFIARNGSWLCPAKLYIDPALPPEMTCWFLLRAT
jgi:hypothetical protein